MEEEQQPKIMTKPLPDILEELETWHNENKALIEEARDLISRLKEALDEVKEATTVAKQAAAEAQEAGLKAAEKVALAAHEEIAEVRNIAVEARVTANLVGMALMTAADGTRITSDNLIEVLKPKFEFKK